MLIYGSRASRIADFDIEDDSCEYCGNSRSQRISVFGKYAHLFWIPLFPIGKKVVGECNHCKRTIEKKEFSPKLQIKYDQVKKQARTPFWHFLGLGLVGLLFLSSAIIGAFAEKDLRDDQLDAHVEMMTTSPSVQNDSISFKLKAILDEATVEELEPESFKYYSTATDDKALLLVQIPKLKKLEKSVRPELLDVLKTFLDNQATLEGKDKYIGVQGVVSWMLLSTPGGTKNSRFASHDELLKYYHPEPIRETKE